MTRRRCIGAFVLVAALALASHVRAMPGPARFYLAGAGAALVEQGVGLAAPADTTPFLVVPAPGLRSVQNDAQATAAPWIDSNAWRFQRGVTAVNYNTLPRVMSVTAAAEAFAFGVDAILAPDPADVADLGNFLRFLKSEERPLLPARANIGIVDDHSPAMDEVLNMLTRRNLLYRIVTAPDPALNVFVQLGTDAFPREAAANPSDFAARVRAWVGDDNRLVRVFGSSTAIVHLTGDGTQARLFVLSYSRNRAQPAGVMVRLRGVYQPTHVAAFGASANVALADVQHPGDATEFTLPAFNALAIIDLMRVP